MKMKEAVEMTIRAFANLTPFTAGAYALDADGAYRAALSENLYGPSQLAIRAGVAEVPRSNYYPNSNNEPLSSEIAHFYGLNSDQVIVGNGADEILLMATLGCAGPGARVGTTGRSFGGHMSSIELAGAHITEIPFGVGYNVAEILTELPTLDMLIFANPHNPTGSYLSGASLRAIASRAADNDCLVVVDEAYAEFADASDFESGIHLLRDVPGLIVVRTFSKAYGLAGLRCGYGLSSPPIIDAMRTTRNSLPYNVNRVALAAARAALKDQAHLSAVVNRSRADRQCLISALQEEQIEALDSQANFVLAQLGDDCEGIISELAEQGLLLRDAASMGYPGWARIGVMPKEGTDTLITQLRSIANRKEGAQ